jgi:hypothetical protein
LEIRGSLNILLLQERHRICPTVLYDDRIITTGKLLVKRPKTVIASIIFFVAPAVFFFCILSMILVSASEVRSLQDVVELYLFFAVALSAMVISLVLIRFTELPIRSVLATWFVEIFPAFF